MIYTATIRNGLGTEILAQQTFASIKAAKGFVRAEFTPSSIKAAVIADNEFPTRHLRAWARHGKIFWGGDCPESWRRA